MKQLILASTIAALCVLAAPVNAAFPEKPISIVIPFAAGGPTDIVGRTIAEAMSKAMPGSKVIVENTAGAGGTIAASKVTRAAPDGHTLLLHHIGMSTAPALYRKLSFDPLKDFEYIGLVTDVPMTLLAKKSLPLSNLKQLIFYVKSNRDKINLAHAGIGSASHLCGLLFQSAIETDLTTVPYGGTAPAMTDLRGGQVDLLCDQTTQTTAVIRSGDVKAFAITSPKRLESLKDIPTMTEEGLPAASLAVWHGVYAPKGTPKPVVETIQKALQAALKDPAVVKRFADLGTVPVGSDKVSSDALQKHLTAEIAKWGPIIKKANVYAD